MKIASCLLALFVTCVHASGRFEATANFDFLRGEFAAPKIPLQSGFIPYINSSLRWAWPNGIKLGIKVSNPVNTPLAVCRRPAFIPSEFLPGLAPPGYYAIVQDRISAYRVVFPQVQLVELTLPLYRSRQFSLHACLAAGCAHWKQCLIGSSVDVSDLPDLQVIYAISERKFAYSALLGMQWELSSHFGLNFYGGYMSLGKVDFGRITAFKSQVGGMTFGLGLGLQL